MSDAQTIPTHRTLRLYEWLALLALMFLCAGAHAASVYKCVGDDGSIAYQASPCAESQRTQTIDIAPAPAFAPSPKYAVDTLKPARTVSNRRELRAERNHVDMAFECRGSNGDVFYRLGHCPHSVAEQSDAHRGVTHGSKSVAISGHPVPRSQACAEMRRAGAIGRKGHEFDETISSYDRNVGNDPCK